MEEEEEPLRFPIVTAGAMAAVLFAQLAFADYGTQSEVFSPQPLRSWIYFFPSEVWAGGYWALLTSSLVHIVVYDHLTAIMHLILSLIGLWIFGRRVEASLGHSATFGILFFGAIASCAAAIFSGSSLLAMGSTGAVFALIGMMVATRHHHLLFAEMFLNPDRRRILFFWLVLVLTGSLFRLFPVTNAAHLGGWLLGFFAGGAFILPKPRPSAFVGLVALVSMTFVAVTWMPWHLDWVHWRAGSEVRAGNYKAALKRVEPWLEKEHVSPRARNFVAWTLATARDADVRQGDRAIELAREACMQTGWMEPSLIDTLAAAYAEADEWPEAVVVQRLAVRTAEATGGSEIARILRQNLALIERREKIRE